MSRNCSIPHKRAGAAVVRCDPRSGKRLVTPRGGRMGLPLRGSFFLASPPHLTILSHPLPRLRYPSARPYSEREIMQVLIRPEALEPRRLMAAAYTVVDLGALGGNDSIAFNLNDQNQVVGFALNAIGQHRGFVFHDTNNNRLADPGEMRDLGVLPGDAASYAYGINNAGQIVGTSRTLPTPNDAVERAVRFDAGAGAPTDLGLGDGSNAYDIGPGGEIVGGLTSGNNYLAYVRDANGTVTTFMLPSPYNGYSEARAIAVGINAATYTAGYSGSIPGDSGFIRTPSGALLPVGHASPAQP